MKELSDLFVQVVKLTKECGSVKLGTIGVYSTKINANASRHKAMSCDRMQQAERDRKEQVEALLAKAKSKAAGASEKNEPGLDVPAEIARREYRRAVIQAARGRSDDDVPLAMPARRKRYPGSNTSSASPNRMLRKTSPIWRAAS